MNDRLLDSSNKVRVHLLLSPRNVSFITSLERTVHSLRHQLYREWLFTLPTSQLPSAPVFPTDDTRFSPVALDTPLSDAASPDDWYAVIDAGDSLPEYSLALIVKYLESQPSASAIYTDEDSVSELGVHHSPRLKPDWSPHFFSGKAYIGRLVLLRTRDLISHGVVTIGDLFDAEQNSFSVVLSGIPRSCVSHLRRILYHRHGNPKVPSTEPRPVSHLRQNWPRVNVVVPTRNHAELLKACVHGLINSTDYPHFIITIVDNGSTDPDARMLLRKLRHNSAIRILESPGAFNFSALCNKGASSSDDSVVVFLNNDIEMVEPDWLKPLVSWATRSDVGAVGAKLLYPNGRIQHAGIVLGLGGIAAHLYRGNRRDDPGYLEQLLVPREVSAVTGACIAIERYKFDAVRGFDEDNLPVELNDVDLCLRLSERGWGTLWTPEATLIHHESQSRGDSLAAAARYKAEITYFSRRWAHVIRDDQYFHPALSLYSYEPSLA